MFKISRALCSVISSKALQHCNTPVICNQLEFLQKARKTNVISYRLVSSTEIDFTHLEKIYEGPLENKILKIKLITLITSFISLPVQLRILYLGGEWSGTLATKIVLMFLTAFQIVTPLAVHFVAKRYVVRMYHNSETNEYTMVTYGFLPKEKYTTFKCEDVRPPTVELFSTLVVKNKMPIFIDPIHFTKLEHYKKLLGYDKPIDFSVDEDKVITRQQSQELKTK